MAVLTDKEREKRKKKQDEELRNKSLEKAQNLGILTEEQYAKEKGATLSNIEVENSSDIWARSAARNSKEYRLYELLSGKAFSSEEEKIKQNSWINGNGKKDVTGLLWTGLDVATQISKGILKTGEAISDLGSYGVAGIANILGAEEYAKGVKEGAAFNLIDAALSPTESKINKNSWSGNKLDSVFESIGQSYSSAKVGSAFLPKGGNISVKAFGKTMNLPVMSFITGSASGMQEAYQNGGTNTQALIKGITSGTSE